MSARIINFEAARASRARSRMISTNEHTRDRGAEAAELMQRFQFWNGASGQRYVHTIYTLLDCPALSSGNFILVNRDESGHRTILEIGLLSGNAPTLNLAEIRQRGATLGANEVHVHLLADSDREAKRIAFDLQCGHYDTTDAYTSLTQH
ncbi:MAG TPA: hypothetical protein P5114_01185 [Hyphomicrobiaceae bacterium]|nr:hypothetical protein [Hyphomicrobiaceae bacterium]